MKKPASKPAKVKPLTEQDVQHMIQAAIDNQRHVDTCSIAPPEKVPESVQLARTLDHINQNLVNYLRRQDELKEQLVECERSIAGARVNHADLQRKLDNALRQPGRVF